MVSSTLSGVKNQNRPVSSSVVGSALASPVRPWKSLKWRRDAEASALEAVRRRAGDASCGVPHLDPLGDDLRELDGWGAAEVEDLDLVLPGREGVGGLQGQREADLPGRKDLAVAVVSGPHHEGGWQAHFGVGAGADSLDLELEGLRARRRLDRGDLEVGAAVNGERRGADLPSIGEVMDADRLHPDRLRRDGGRDREGAVRGRADGAEVDEVDVDEPAAVERDLRLAELGGAMRPRPGHGHDHRVAPGGGIGGERKLEVPRRGWEGEDQGGEQNDDGHRRSPDTWRVARATMANGIRTRTSTARASSEDLNSIIEMLIQHSNAPRVKRCTSR